MARMKYLFFLLVAGAGYFLTQGLPAGSGGTQEVEQYARRLQSRVGVRFGGAEVTAIRADGNTLVVTVDGPANWRAGHQSFQLTRPFLLGFCKTDRAAAYFGDGRAIRLDTTEEGSGLIRGLPSTRCPDA